MADQAKRSSRTGRDHKEEAARSAFAPMVGKRPRRGPVTNVAPEWVRHSTVNAILEYEPPLTVESVREGLPVQTVESLAGRLHVTSAAMQRWLSLSKQTYARRRKHGHLSALESDRVVRYAELLCRAIELLGDGDAGARWLNTASPALGGEAPIDHASTEFGARDVLRLIGRLEHGIPT